MNVFLLAWGVLASTAWAQDVAAPPQPPMPAGPAAPSAERSADVPAQAADPQPAPGDAWAAALAGEVAGLASTSSSSDAALKAHYASDEALLWVDQNGALAQAKDVAAELARAGEYGLEANAYAVPALQATASNAPPAQIEYQLSHAVLAYVRDAWGGRSAGGKLGTQLSDPPKLPEASAVLAELRASSDRAAYLRAQHPDHPQFEALRQKIAKIAKSETQTAKTRIPDGPVMRRGDANAQVAALRTRLELPTGENEQIFDAEVETALKAFQKENGLAADGIMGAGTRAALNADTPDKQRYQLLINLERWRWLPRPLDGNAEIYIWANIPEFRTRIVKKGEIAFDERAIAGKVDKQTPVFSDLLEWIEIHPTWYVPNSIKVDDILPSLRRNTSRIMTRYHLRMDCGRHGRDPARIDWNNVDIRACAFSQPPGEKSVLGDFKFKFPNKHDVYMHDTLTRRLFQASPRTFSHGCIRVQNPQRMAAILLDHDKGFAKDRLDAILAGPKRLHKEVLQRPVPVHITYFTASVDKEGTVVSHPDYYGHDKRLANALYGKGNLFPVAKAPGRRARKPRPKPVVPKKEWWEEAMQN
jgi:murein L,D-transpeptidase YcbB/YkuD